MLIDVGNPVLISLREIREPFFSGLYGREVFNIKPGAEAFALA
jgi:hypothetical protein